MLRRSLLAALAATALAGSTLPAAAQETVKIGLIIPLTGPFTTTGKQLEAAARLYMQQNGTTVAGKKIELIVRDDAGRAENTARIAGELIQNDKVSFIAGFGLTPLAMATAPIATNASTRPGARACRQSVFHPGSSCARQARLRGFALRPRSGMPPT